MVLAAPKVMCNTASVLAACFVTTIGPPRDRDIMSDQFETQLADLEISTRIDALILEGLEYACRANLRRRKQPLATEVAVVVAIRVQHQVALRR